MTLMKTQIKKFNVETDSFRLHGTYFFHPKVVFFEDKQTVRLINLINENEQDSLCQLESDFLDSTLQDQFLWIITKSGKIVVINIVTGSQLIITSDNNENYKISQFKHYNGDLYITSESGECLDIPFKAKDISKKFEESVSEVTVTLRKAHVHHSNLRSTSSTMMVDGINICKESNTVQANCPITGLCDTLTLDSKVEQIALWDNNAVITSSTNMWIVDLKTSEIISKFENCGGYFYPITSHNRILYFILYNNKEVQLCGAWSPSLTGNEDLRNEGGESCLTKALTTQESLIVELKYLVDSLLSSEKLLPLPDQLYSLFDKIDDFYLLLDIASKLCQHNFTYKAVLYSLQKRVLPLSDKTIVDMLHDLIIKTDMLEYIQFRGNKCYLNINLLQLNFIELCKLFLSKTDLDIASICWLKYSEIKLPVSSNDVMGILNAIPYNTKMGGIIVWLKNFVPSLLEQNPFFIDLFVRWGMERIFKLEQSPYWPKIGTKFIDEIVTVLETSLQNIPIRPISMDDLDMLKDRINYIIELKEKYKINMLLEEFSSQSPTEISLIMLRRCYTEDLELYLQDFLPTYATRHLFDMDTILRSFIECEAASSGGGIDGVRLKILLNAFHSLHSKLDCLLQVLKVLDVPWNTNVFELAVTAAASATKDFTVTDTDQVLAQEIQKELNYSKVKVVLKKYNFPLTCNDYTLILHKIVSTPTVDLDDLKVITTVINTLKNYGNILYIDRCLQDCEIKTALNYFHNLLKAEKKTLLKTILMKYEQVINRENSSNRIIERNYIDFIKGTRDVNSIQMSNIENLYHCKISLKLKSDMGKVKSGTESNDNVSGNHIGMYLNVSQYPREYDTRHFVLMELLRRTSTSHQVRMLVENFISPIYRNRDDESILTYFKDGQNADLLEDCYNLLIEVATNCSEEHLNYVTKHLSIFNSLFNSITIVKNLTVTWKFHYIFLPISSNTAVNELIAFYRTAQSKLKDVLNTTNIEQNCNFVPFRMISNAISNSDKNGKIIEDIYEMKDRAARKLLAKVTASPDLDEILVTSLLLILRRVEVIEDNMWILEVLKGQNDFLSPVVTSFLSSPAVRRTFIFDNDTASGVPCPPHYILKSKFNIHLCEMALPENTEETWDVKVILFYVLKQYPDITFERLSELCKALNVAINDGLSLQLISLLSTWELRYRITHDELGCRQILLENNEKDLSKCNVIWDSIENKDFLKDILNDFWNNGEVTLHGRVVSINPYYYEVYLCMYHLIFDSSADSKHVKEYFLLNFLKEYRRKSSPKQYEFELFSVKGIFPEIGHFRLPFHLFTRDDMWSNLKSEITLETYERWLPAVALLSLDADLQTARDMICSNALKQTMTSRKRCDDPEIATKDSEPWRLTTTEEPLLRAAHRCVRHIANMEWAGACLFYVLQGCARGADQVAAAQLCYQFAQRWASLQPGNRAVRQMERLHATLSTRHALHKIQWACEELVRLSTEPAQLIRALYLHPQFVEKMTRCDVNRAANEIADKNAINISSIRIQILENILEKPNEQMKNKRFSALSTTQLMTAKHILKATCPKMGAIYLSRIAFDDESDYNKCKKLRALQCLMSVVEPDTAMKVTNKERDALWSSLLEMFCIVNLENIDMPWIVVTFMQDKVRALDQLIQAADGNVEGLKVAAELARSCGTAQTIRNLIPLLLRAGLYEQMIPLLLSLAITPDKVVYAAWRAIILSPFQRADYPITENQKTKCLNSINLLPICPIVKDEDLVEIWKNCVRCKCFGLGCLVLPYMTPETRKSLVELKKIDRRNLIASLKNLQSETYLVSGAMHVVESMASRVYR